jgi:hypothetical protein
MVVEQHLLRPSHLTATPTQDVDHLPFRSMEVLTMGTATAAL